MSVFNYQYFFRLFMKYLNVWFGAISGQTHDNQVRTSNIQLMENKFVLYGLAYGCPYIERRANCPLNEIDSLSFARKVDWIDGLSEAKKRSILEIHLQCSQIRENKVRTDELDDQWWIIDLMS